jgi:hypothetical protein
MRRLHARLTKLEAVAETSQWNWNYSDVQACARKKLSSEESILLDEGIALIRDGRQKEWKASHLAIWKRWDILLGQATIEVHFPIYIRADDTLS